MGSYVAFLRAVNVGKRQFRMADVRECLAASGLDDVETYIQTGNVRFRTTMRSPARVQEHLERVLEERCGFDVPSIVFTPEELRSVHEDAKTAVPPHGDVRGDVRYVSLFKDGEQPTGEEAERIAAWDRPGEAGLVLGRAVHIWIDGGMHSAKFFGAFGKELLPGTNRNLKVVTTLAERWGA